MTTTATAAATVIRRPGVYAIPEEEYHKDPVPGGSLSSSGARALLKCPAKYHHDRTHGRPPKRDFDFGHAAHRLVLGAGADIVIIDADSYRTKNAQEQRAAAYTAGAVPLLPQEAAIVHAMADAIRQHPVAGALFNPGHGAPEQSLFWTDKRTGVRCRARLDWLPDRGHGRMVIPDYKTARSADPHEFARAAVTYGYHQQHAYYVEGCRVLGVADDDTQFVFVVQEKTPPYVVSVIQLDPAAAGIGRHLNHRALDLYKECTATGRWPGYSDEVCLVSLPAWEERKYSDSEIFSD